jgi:anti-sigma B factor antagonist
MSLAITSRLISGVVVVDISGRLCFLETALQQHINELLEQGHRNFVLNLTDVPYIDSFGLGQLITVWTSIRARDGQLVLLRPTDHVRQLLQLTKLDSIFHISEEESQAVESALTSCGALA